MGMRGPWHIGGSMGDPAHIGKARRLRDLSIEIETLADAVEQPSRSIERAERLVAEGERISREIYSVFRGRC